jgi:hypothetical protein
MKIMLKNLFILNVFIALSGLPFREGWILEGNSFHSTMTLSVPVISQPQTRSDLDQDQQTECIQLEDGQLAILDKPCEKDSHILWVSPSTWQVTQAEISDLNWNGIPEVALLVWRTFTPWPVDAFLQHPGRIDDHHTKEGKSCHIILVEFQPKGNFSESWAGSALSRPISEFVISDPDNDNRSELITLESRYENFSKVADTLSIWEWSGFGFQLIARSSGHYGNLQTGFDINGMPVILVKEW